jgi:hypothetical protein
MKCDPRELLAAAAALVVDEGMEYAAAKRKAGRAVGHRGELPSNERLEDAVREHIAVFHADEQPEELKALRLLALSWMDRLAPFKPHLGGAAWRGTATRRSALLIDLYCDDPKSAEIELLNQRIDFDVGVLKGAGRVRGEAIDVLTLVAPCATLQDTVTLHLLVNDLDALRGALKPDAHGRSWRGDPAALRRLLESESPP